MSKLDELIQQYCPNGVEYKSLKDVCDDFIVPMRDRPKVFDGDIPWCRIEDKQGQFFNGSLSGLGVSENVIKQMNLKVFPTGTVICSCSASLGTYAINTRPLITNQTFIGIVCGELLFNKYLLYFMETQTSKLISLSNSGTIPYVSRKKFEELEIPVPPLPVQEEIVRILDNFTELQAELQAELQKRLQQYNYYRDNLLSFEGRTDVEWKKLGDVSSIKTGRRFVRTDIRESGVPCFHYGDLYTYYGLTATQTKGYLDAELASKLRFAQPNDVVVVCAGENDMDIGVGVAWLGNEPAVVHDACCILHHDQNPRYISHFLRTHNYHLQMKKYVKNGKISSLPSSGLANALIPIPSLEEQERIATILDKFYALTTDITAGLPAEIEARRKQYEYYRDQLLTFKQKA